MTEILTEAEIDEMFESRIEEMADHFGVDEFDVEIGGHVDEVIVYFREENKQSVPGGWEIEEQFTDNTFGDGMTVLTIKKTGC